MAGATLPGVKVGPLDPDATSSFGQVARGNSARQLIRLHSQAHPPALVQALARALDPERTKGLQIEEVRSYLGGLERDNGDPLVPDGSTVVAAAVRGKPDTEQVLTFTYETASGRTGKWFAAYSAKDLPDSFEAGAELAQVKEMKDRGIVAFDSEGTATEILRRQLAEERRKTHALRAMVDGQAAAADDGEQEVPEPSGDPREGALISDENERLGREVEELRAELATAQAALAMNTGMPGSGGGSVPPSDEVASADEPIDGYDDMNARDVASLLKADDTDQETRQAILAYEVTHANRRTVVGAAEESLSAHSG